MAAQNENIRDLLVVLDGILMEIPGMTSKIRHNIPFQDGERWICYLNPVKRNGVELAFLRANELSDVQHVLDIKDRKQVAGITLHHKSEIRMENLRLMAPEALMLDIAFPQASKRTNTKK